MFVAKVLAGTRFVVDTMVAETVAEIAILDFGFQDTFLAFFGWKSSTGLKGMIGCCLVLAAIAFLRRDHILGVLARDLKVRTIAVISWVRARFEMHP